MGLRWWSNVLDNGQTEWLFESAKSGTVINSSDSTIFWAGLYLTPIIWGVFFFFGLIQLKIKWLLICACAISLSSANIIGYYKCSSDQKAKLNELMKSGANMGVSSLLSNASVRGAVFDMFTSNKTGKQGKYSNVNGVGDNNL